MIRLLLKYAPLVLALTVALTSVTHVQARNTAHGAQSMVICTGYGMVRITLDANGNPVEQSLPCPDCVVTPVAVLADTLQQPASTRAARAVVQQGQTLWRGASAGVWCDSRGPPSLV
jgi:hypothetical protein